MDYLIHLLALVGIYAIAAISLNYMAGFTGIVSFSHATFLGIGAYATAILTTRYGFSFIASFFLGAAISGAIAWLSSFALLRLKEDSFSLVSFGFAIIMYNLMLNLTSLTNGPLGVKGIPGPAIGAFSFTSRPTFLSLVLLFAVATYFFFRHIAHSYYGTVLKSIRENPVVAMTNGHNVSGYQRSVFVVGAIFAALAGSFLAAFLTFIEPKSFELISSVLILIMVILGGLGNLKGVVLGAFILLIVPEALRFAGIPSAFEAETQQIIYGAILVLLMFIRPQGILGDYRI